MSTRVTIPHRAMDAEEARVCSAKWSSGSEGSPQPGLKSTLTRYAFHDLKKLQANLLSVLCLCLDA